MTTEETQKLIREIGTLKAECEELRVRNEMLQYHLERANCEMRDLEREIQELSATLGIRVPNFSAHEHDPAAPLGWGCLGWGKGKDE